MDFEAAKAEVRTWGQKVTPYRVGIAQGRAQKSAFEAWRDNAQQTRNYGGRPAPAECPYSVNVSIRSWEAGYWMGKGKR